MVDDIFANAAVPPPSRALWPLTEEEEIEQSVAIEISHTEDAREAPNAFVESRKPVFKGDGRPVNENLNGLPPDSARPVAFLGNKIAKRPVF